MSEATAAPAAPAKKSWIKAVVGTFAGLASGAAMMYVTPLVDKVVKPSKPVANFAVEVTGAKLVVQNRSTGTEGWLDFGDGSPLEQVTSPTQAFTHTYAKAGSYTVKLSARSFLGDENERAVPVEVKSTTAEPPRITKLEAVPVSGQNYAPATFKLVCATAGAETAVWDLGDRALEVGEAAPQAEKTVTFAQPGNYKVELLALSGKQAARQSVLIPVVAPPTNALMGIVQVSESGTKVETRTAIERLPLTVGGKAEAFTRTLTASPGYTYADATVPDSKTMPAGLSKVAVQVAADRKSVTVTGEVAAGKGGMTVLPVAVRTQRATAAARPTMTPSAQLKVPGTTVVPLPATPADWTNVQRASRLELRDGSQVVLAAGTTLPQNAPLVWQGKRYTVTATPMQDRVQIDIR